MPFFISAEPTGLHDEVKQLVNMCVSDILLFIQRHIGEMSEVPVVVYTWSMHMYSEALLSS